MNDYLDFYKMNHKDLIDIRVAIKGLINEYEIMIALGKSKYLQERVNELNNLLERTNWDKLEMINS